MADRPRPRITLSVIGMVGDGVNPDKDDIHAKMSRPVTKKPAHSAATTVYNATRTLRTVYSVHKEHTYPGAWTGTDLSAAASPYRPVEHETGQTKQ